MTYIYDLYYKIPEGIPTIQFSIGFPDSSFYIYSLNLSTEIKNMDIFDANDYIHQRCNDLYSNFVSDQLCDSVTYQIAHYAQCLSLSYCIMENAPSLLPPISFYRQLSNFFTTYLSIFV